MQSIQNYVTRNVKKHLIDVIAESVDVTPEDDTFCKGDTICRDFVMKTTGYNVKTSLYFMVKVYCFIVMSCKKKYFSLHVVIYLMVYHLSSSFTSEMSMKFE